MTDSSFLTLGNLEFSSFLGETQKLFMLRVEELTLLISFVLCYSKLSLEGDAPCFSFPSSC